MKTKIIPIFSALIIVVLLSSCEDTSYKIYKGNSPVYMSYEDLRTAVKTQQNVPLENPGKIYFKDNYIFIVEELKGIHVFDNTNPASPVKKTYVNLPGVADISIAGSTLYADSYVDMVILNVQDMNNITEAGRIKDIFPYIVPPTGNDYPMAYIDEERGVVKEWVVGTIKEKIDNPYNNPYPIFREQLFFKDMINSSGASSGVSGSGVGTGGSMARFGIKDNVLYTVNSNNLMVFDITNKTNPLKVNDFYAGWGIETMFLTDNYMFLGTTTGMIIYNISIPLSPQSQQRFSHARSCDPVIVDDTLAYITLRGGTTCGGSTNSLSVVNIKNINSPKLVSTFALVNPHGLGKDGNLLFICDGSAGLKIFDAEDPKTITSHPIFAYPNIHAYDVIPLGSVLVLVGDDGLYQYDYSIINSISLLSHIPISDSK